jgi:hypothetical protein
VPGTRAIRVPHLTGPGAVPSHLVPAPATHISAAAARRRPTINRKHAQKHLPSRRLLHRLRTEKKVEIPLQGGAECLIRGKYCRIA